MLEKKTWKKYRKGDHVAKTNSDDGFQAVRKRYARIVLFVVVILLLAACAVTLPPPNDQALLKKSPADTDRMQEGITYLGSPGKANDYVRARAAFVSLLKTYPDSRWHSLSETLISLIDTMESCKEKDILVSEKGEEISRLLLENGTLKKEVLQLHEKLKTETARLSEENERLKNDIQLLKKLEVQLEQREKMLR
jgi:archaellum component FlaG (FlaF/FlaG flagellin family)